MPPTYTEDGEQCGIQVIFISWCKLTIMHWLMILAAVWQDDSVEIYIDADNSKGTSYDGVNDYQYQFGYNDPTVYVGVGPQNTAGIVFQIVQVSGGYILECSIPWTTLGVAPAGRQSYRSGSPS